MSGSSAIASARRRRTAPDPPLQTNQQNQQNQQNQGNINNRQQLTQETITPLELLKQHEEKLSDLDNIINNRVENIITKKIEELKLLEHKSNNENTSNNENNSNIDLNDNIKEFINNSISKNISTINDTIKSILLNIEKLGELSNLNNNYMKNLDELKGEVNTLKMLLIKNQTLAIETHSDMLKMKDTQTIQDKYLEDINNKISDQSTSMKELEPGNIFQNLLMSSLKQNNEEYILNSESNSENEYNNKKIIIENDEQSENFDNETLDIIKNEVKDIVSEDFKNEVKDGITNIEEIKELT